MPKGTCSIDGCELPLRATGWCKRHYNTWYRTGDPLTPPMCVENAQCKADGCTRRPRSKGCDWCEMHYGRIRRNGTLFNIPHSTECAAPKCDADVRCCGMCSIHHGRFNRHGSFEPKAGSESKGETNHAWRGNGVGYYAIHSRLTSHIGRAADRTCADCGQPARHWSYDHTDPDEQRSECGPYSTDLSHYQSRCVPCHKAYDLSHLQQHARHE